MLLRATLWQTAVVLKVQYQPGAKQICDHYTGSASGPYNIATTLTDIYSKNLKTNSKTQTTGASVENLNLMAQKKVEMAFVMSDALNDALNGTGSFKNKIENVEQIAALYLTMYKLSPLNVRH